MAEVEIQTNNKHKKKAIFRRQTVVCWLLDKYRWHGKTKNFFFQFNFILIELSRGGSQSFSRRIFIFFYFGIGKSFHFIKYNKLSRFKRKVQVFFPLSFFLVSFLYRLLVKSSSSRASIGAGKLRNRLWLSQRAQAEGEKTYFSFCVVHEEKKTSCRCYLLFAWYKKKRMNEQDDDENVKLKLRFTHLTLYIQRIYMYRHREKL